MPKSNKVNRQFFKAVRNGPLSKVEEFIERYCLSYSPHWLNGYALLCNAIEHKQTEAAKLLLNNGSEVNSKRRNPFMTPLHYAVENNNLEVVEMLLNKGAHVDIEASYGITPLFIAVRRNYLHSVYLLLNHGAVFDVASTSWNESGKTLLHFACANGHQNLVDLLLRRDADVNAKDRNGSTPLHCAAENENLEVVVWLLLHGADIDAKNLKNQTPLSIAVDKDSLTIVQNILFFKPDSSDEYNRLAFCSAVQSTEHLSCCSFAWLPQKRYSKEFVEYLLDYGFAIEPGDASNSLLLYAAVENGYEKIVENLLNYGSDANFSGFIPYPKSPLLHTAVQKGHNSIVQLLIKYGADVDSKDRYDRTPIYLAVENGYEEIVENLLKLDADANWSGTTVWGKFSLLHAAVLKDDNPIVQLLIKYGADVNTKDETGRTPIYFAIRRKNLEIAMQLLDNKAVVESSFDLICLAIETKNTRTVEKILSSKSVDINATNSSGTTTLHIAAEYGQTEMVKLFLDKRANVNDVTANGKTALFKACRKGYKQVVEILLEFGAKCEFEGTRHAIPLHAATEEDHTKVVEVLLRYDADIDFKNDEGETALHIASQKGYAHLIHILLKHGSDINNMTKYQFTAFDLASSSSSTTVYNSYFEMDKRGFPYKEKVINYLQCHMIKLTAANFYLIEKNVCSIDRNEFRDFRTDCEKEIEDMKSEKISNNISFYDILTKGINRLTAYSINENVMKALSTDDYKTKFPIYASMINLQFKKGIKRNDLLEQSYRPFDILCDSFPRLPPACIDNIFYYLSNSDLRNLVNTCK